MATDCPHGDFVFELAPTYYQRILEEEQIDPLSILVRSDWEERGKRLVPAQYEVLLTTGGPAARVTGDLDNTGMPRSAKLQEQAWFKPWTTWTPAEEAALLEFAQSFFF